MPIVAVNASLEDHDKVIENKSNSKSIRKNKVYLFGALGTWHYKGKVLIAGTISVYPVFEKHATRLVSMKSTLADYCL